MIALEWRGRVPYAEALAAQRERRDAVLAGLGGEAIWLLEHDPVVTTGRRAVPGLDPRELGCPVVETERGGLATWHGPGQLVGYLLVDVSRRGGSVKGTVTAVEEGILGWLRARGLAAGRRSGAPGVWVGPNKICSIGLHFRRGVSMHGFALNLTADLRTFARFVPCGIVDGGVTSVARELGRAPLPAEVWPEVGGAVRAALVDSFRGGR